jgi:hypothetical protein
MNTSGVTAEATGLSREVEPKPVTADAIVQKLKKIELSKKPAGEMLAAYRSTLAEGKHLPAEDQWKITHQAIATLTAIEGARDNPGIIRGLDRFMRRATRLLGGGGIESLLDRVTRGGPRVHPAAEKTLAKVARAPDENRIFSLLENSPQLVPDGSERLDVLVGNARLSVERAGEKNRVRFHDSAGRSLGPRALLDRDGPNAPRTAHALGRTIRRAVAARLQAEKA